MRKKMGESFAKGGEVPKKHVKAELAFMKDKGAPKSMIASEKKEHGFAGGGSSGGGSAGTAGKSRFVGHGAFNFGKSKAKPFAEGGSIDDATRSRAMEWVEKRRAQQDAEGAGDASAAEPSPKPAPVRRRAPAATAGPSHAPGPTPVIEQKSTTVYSNEGKGKAAPAATAAPAKAPERDTTGFAETAFNAIRDAITSKPKPSVRTPMSAPRYAKGGSIDGCASRGKTRGKVI